MPIPAIPIIKAAAIGVAVAVTVVGGVLPALGFGAAGVATSSVAAGTQAAIGNVVAGSAFAFAQSVGATGVTTAVAAGGAALGAAPAVTRAALQWWR